MATVSFPSAFRAVCAVPTILTHSTALQDGRVLPPPHQTTRSTPRRPFPALRRLTELGAAVTPPQDLCTAAFPLCTFPARCAEVKQVPMPFFTLVNSLTGEQSHAGEPAAAQRRPALLRATPEPPHAP